MSDTSYQLNKINDTLRSKTTGRSGTNFLELLALLFIGLKLTGYIGWSWLWVLSPLWLPLAIAVVLAIIIFIIVVIVEAVK